MYICTCVIYVYIYIYLGVYNQDHHPTFWNRTWNMSEHTSWFLYHERYPHLPLSHNFFLSSFPLITMTESHQPHKLRWKQVMTMSNTQESNTNKKTHHIKSDQDPKVTCTHIHLYNLLSSPLVLQHRKLENCPQKYLISVLNKSKNGDSPEFR